MVVRTGVEKSSSHFDYPLDIWVGVVKKGWNNTVSCLEFCEHSALQFFEYKSEGKICFDVNFCTTI